MYRYHIGNRVIFTFIILMTVATLSAADPQSGDSLTKDLSAWQGAGGSIKAWSVENGVLKCDGSRGKDHAKWIATKQKYDDFDLSLEFNVAEASNSGVFLRAPLAGNPARTGLEVQLFDNDAPKYKVKPVAVHTGAIWNVAPPSKDMHKKAGQWQTLRIVCVGRYCGVWHNGQQVVSVNLDDYPELAPKFPGLLRTDGYIGLQNHGAPFAFRNVRIKRIKDATKYPKAPSPNDGRKPNQPPIGFAALFNGKDLTGWKSKGNVADHWTIKDGVIYYDGKGGSLISEKEFGDYIMYADWILDSKGGDSGIYLRGAPQVQIWDIEKHKEGSGGIWNNKKTGVGKDPLTPADNPVGQWNTFRIQLVGQKVTVHLNGKLIVDAAPVESLQRNGKTIDRGPILLQHHGSPLRFTNIFIKELPPGKPDQRN